MTMHKGLPKVDYQKILYTTDLSEAGRHAFPHAASLANRYGAELIVFHVVKTVEFERSVVGFISESMWAELKTRSLEEAREMLVSRRRHDAAIKSAVDDHLIGTTGEEGAKPSVTYEVVVRAGDPVEEILKEAHEGGYDLVVMGNRGERALKDKLMGSTAWRVLHGAQIPVMLVRVPED
jgi:nucleotide-binding universal stress UspA family protein